MSVSKIRSLFRYWLASFGPKSNIHGTLTTVLIHRDPIANFLAILLYCHMKKNTGGGSNDYSLKKWKC